MSAAKPKCAKPNDLIYRSARQRPTRPQPLRKHDQVISMDRRATGQVRQQPIGGDILLVSAGGQRERVGIGLGDTARQHKPIGRTNIEHITGGKRALNTRDAHGQQR